MDTPHDIATHFERLFVRATDDDQTWLARLRDESPDLAEQVERRLAHVAAARRVLQAARRIDEEPPSVRLDPERYEVLEEIARGGMGSIHRVRDLRLGRDLALKVARSFSANSEIHGSLLARFLNEARITGRLEHPGIVPVHELGTDQRDQSYFTMKLVGGVTLLDALNRMHSGDPSWPTSRVLRVIVQATDALSYAHSRGVVHRDIKPSNIMIGEFGEVYVMDWGVARFIGEVGDDGQASPGPLHSHQTVAGAVVGTPAYMSPEQAGSDSDVGPHFDIYSVGAILYHVLAGHAPYADTPAADPWEVLQRLHRGPPAPAGRPHSPAELVAICSRAMARDPARRYPDVEGLAEDLRAHLEHRIVSAHRRDVVTAIKKWCVRRPGAATATGLAAVLMIALIVASVQWRSARALEQERQDDLLVDRLRDLRDQSMAVSVGELDHHAAIDRFVDQFGREFIDLTGSQTPEAVVEVLRRRCASAPLRDIVRELLYDTANHMLQSGHAYAEMSRLDPGFVLPSRASRDRVEALAAQPQRSALWTRVNRIIERFDGGTWRADAWGDVCDAIHRQDPSTVDWIDTEPEGLTPTDVTWLAEMAFLFGRRDREVELLRVAVDRDVTDYWSIFRLGNRYFRAGMFEEAVSCLERARVADPDGKMCSTNLALALVNRSREVRKSRPEQANRFLHRARQVGEEAVRLAPRNHRAHTALGVALLDAGALDAAIQCFEAAVALDPDDPQASINLGVAHQNRRSWDDALFWYANARAKAPHDPAGYMDAIKVLRLTERFAEAADLAESAVAAMPANPLMIEVAASELRECGYLARSLRVWERGARLAEEGRWPRKRDPAAEMELMATRLRAAVDRQPENLELAAKLDLASYVADRREFRRATMLLDQVFSLVSNDHELNELCATLGYDAPSMLVASANAALLAARGEGVVLAPGTAVVPAMTEPMCGADGVIIEFTAVMSAEPLRVGSQERRELEALAAAWLSRALDIHRRQSSEAAIDAQRSARWDAATASIQRGRDASRPLGSTPDSHPALVVVEGLLAQLRQQL